MKIYLVEYGRLLQVEKFYTLHMLPQANTEFKIGVAPKKRFKRLT